MGRPPIGKRAMTAAERQRRRRDQERQTRSDDDERLRLRRRLLGVLDVWARTITRPVATCFILEVLEGLSRFVISQGHAGSREERLAFRRRYLDGDRLDDAEVVEIVERLREHFNK